MALTAKKKLDAREQRFVDEYPIDLDPCRAAIAAGYSKSVAESKAYQWVSNSKVKPHVFVAVKMALKARSERTEISQDRVLQEYAKLAFLDPRRFYSENGALIPVHQLPADVAAALAGMEVAVSRGPKDDDGSPGADVIKIKFADKKGALDSVARHLGMFNDRMVLTGKDGGPVQFERIERTIIDPK